MCVWEKLDSKQFAFPGRSPTQALVHLLHTILESVDGGGMYVRMFFSGFSQVKDLIWLIVIQLTGGTPQGTKLASLLNEHVTHVVKKAREQAVLCITCSYAVLK